MLGREIFGGDGLGLVDDKEDERLFMDLRLPLSADFAECLFPDVFVLSSVLAPAVCWGFLGVVLGFRLLVSWLTALRRTSESRRNLFWK
jgi:hypothetical protein